MKPDPRLIEAISKSDYKNNLVTYLEQLKDLVADVREGKHTSETRTAVIEIIDKHILSKIRVRSNKVDKNVDDFH